MNARALGHPTIDYVKALLEKDYAALLAGGRIAVDFRAGQELTPCSGFTRGGRQVGWS